MPLDSAEDCTQAEKWLVNQLCKDPVARQFLANRNPESYVPSTGVEVRIEPSAEFRIIGLTVTSADLERS